jgi:hypothetical protein
MCALGEPVRVARSSVTDSVMSLPSGDGDLGRVADFSGRFYLRAVLVLYLPRRSMNLEF